MMRNKFLHFNSSDICSSFGIVVVDSCDVCANIKAGMSAINIPCEKIDTLRKGVDIFSL